MLESPIGNKGLKVAKKVQRGSKSQGSLAQFLQSRPLSRNLALLAVLIGAIGVVGCLIQESSTGSASSHFITLLGIPALLIALATGIALPKQDESYRPWWSAATYLLLLGALAFVPICMAWASQMGFGANPALMPALACAICILAPFAIPNQAAFGLGSAIPKIAVVVWAMHFTDNTSLGFRAANTIVSPQSALVALLMFTAAFSLLMMLFKYRMPAWIMVLVGLGATLPCVLKIEFCMVHFGFM